MNTNPTLRLARDNRGFSMAEMLVVITILSIVTAFSVPAYNIWVDNYRLKVSAGEVYSTFQAARLTAVKENANVVILFDTANNSYTVHVDDGAGGGAVNNVQDGTERTVKQGTLESGINMYSTVFVFVSNRTTFNSRGLLVNSDWGTVDMMNGQSQYRRITVWTTGHVQMQSSADGVSWS